MALKPEQIGIEATNETRRVWPINDLSDAPVNKNAAPVVFSLPNGKFCVAPGWLTVTSDMLELPSAKVVANAVTPKA